MFGIQKLTYLHHPLLPTGIPIIVDLYFAGRFFFCNCSEVCITHTFLIRSWSAINRREKSILHCPLISLGFLFCFTFSFPFSSVTQIYARHLQHITQIYARHLQRITQIYARHLQHITQIYARHLQHITQIYERHLQHITQIYERHLQHILVHVQHIRHVQQKRQVQQIRHKQNLISNANIRRSESRWLSHPEVNILQRYKRIA